MIELIYSQNTSSEFPTHTSANTKVAVTTSRVCPLLSPVAYFIGHHFVLPSFFGQIRVTGQENLPKTSPVILAPTHRSRWDALMVPYAAGRCVTGRDLRFMVTIDECQGLQGWFIRRLGGFSVDPQRPSITCLRHSVELLQKGEMLVIFPEGGIRKGKVHPLKPGIARLALSAESTHPGLGVKIVPISINYSQPDPDWGTDVSIHIGSAIEVASYDKNNLKQGAKSLTTDLATVLKQLSNQHSEFTPRAFAGIPNS
ncbi:MAG: 1-acyl-sn-glycerol-3-phosphate acyltransferase [Rhizonema sp. NSF051]|nr:1-acyl-sn-glycerol-3-phosphate acyltransferase [Rhizonema sp. NSF051]